MGPSVNCRVSLCKPISNLNTRNYNNDKVKSKGEGKWRGKGRERGKGGERGKELSRLDPKHQKYRLGHSAHCRVLLCKSISD